MLQSAVLVLLLASAQETTEEKRVSSAVHFLDVCEKDIDHPECISYAMGFVDAVMFYEVMHQVQKEAAAGQTAATRPLHGQAICLSGKSYKQNLRVIVKYLRDHPADLHMPLGYLGAKALLEAFPCPKK